MLLCDNNLKGTWKLSGRQNGGVILCKECGTIVPEGTEFCPQCRVQNSQSEISFDETIFDETIFDEKKKAKTGFFITLGAVILILLATTGVLLGLELNRSNNYDKAIAFFDSGDFKSAYDVFIQLGDYRDSPEKARLSQQYLVYYQAISDYKNESYERALAALSLLAAENFPGAQDEIRMIDEIIIREGLTEEYKNFANPLYYLWQMDIKMTIDALEQMGVTRSALIAAWTEGMQIQVGTVTVSGNSATAEVTITCKQYHPAANSATRIFLATPVVGTVTEDEMNRKLGELIFSQLKNSRPATTTVTIQLTKSGNTWTISESAEYEYYRALFGM